MSPAEFGFVRTFLAVALLPLGLVLRFGNLPPGSGVGIGLPWTYADAEIWKRSNRRFGELLLGWWVWTMFQLIARFPLSWFSAMWAPFIITAVWALSYPAHLYQKRYGTLRFRRTRHDENPPIPKKGGWVVVILREVIPLAALLVPILIIRAGYDGLPDRIPVRWDLLDGPSDWRWKDEALNMLRHQTMIVYLVLFLAEGGYLIWSWIRGARRDFAKVLLTRSHWLYFVFKLGWVVLFAGINLGFIAHAASGHAAALYLLPGLAVLGLFGGAAAWAHRRAEYSPPAGS